MKGDEIKMKLINFLFRLTMLLFFLLITLSKPVQAEDINDGAKIFSIHCAGCHPQGKNIIRRGKNLKLRALKRNKVDSLDAIINLVSYGKNNMSAYEEKLTKEQIESVSKYVLQQAQNNWHT